MKKLLLFTLALIGTMSVWGADPVAAIKEITAGGTYGSDYSVTTGNTNCKYALKVTNSGSGTINVTIDGVTLENRTNTTYKDGTNTYSSNYGVMYVGKGCNVTLKNSTLHNYFDGSGIRVDDGSSITLQNCTIDVDSYRGWASNAICVMYNGSATINSGTYTSAGAALLTMSSGGTITVNDGTFTCTYDGTPRIDGTKIYRGAIYIDGGSNNGKGTVNVNGGKFKGYIAMKSSDNQAALNITKGVFTTDKVYQNNSKNTGTETVDLTKKVSGINLYPIEDNTIYLANYKAYTGSTFADVAPYDDFAAANAAAATENKEIKLVTDATISSTTTIANRTITPKGDFNTLTVNGGTLTLDGATINAASGQNGIYVNGGNLIAQGTAVLNSGAAAVNVNAGSFTVPESTTITAGTLTKAAGEGATISLKSGTYSQDVADYVADGYKSTKLSDTQWKVEEDKPYTRDVTIGAIGTICLNKDVKAGDFSGAIFYKTAYRISDTRIYFDEVDALEAGKAYIFEATAAKISCKLSGTTADDPIAENGLYGTFEGINYDNGQKSTSDETLKDMYLVNNDIIRLCGKGCWLAPNRAYIKLSEVSTKSTPAPSRRIALVNNDANIATFVEEVGAAAQGVKKAMINGQLVIMKDGKMFNAQGAEL